MPSQFALQNRNLREFSRIGEIMKMIAAKAQIQLRIFNDERDPQFLKLSEPDQLALVERLKIYPNLWKDVIASKDAEVAEKKLLWLALRKLNLAPPSDLMEWLDEDHVIEVYVGLRQTYRSFNYYNLCSYSLDELESQTWEELFHRSAGNVQQILEDCAQAATTRKIVRSKSDTHFVEEVSSALKYKFKYRMDFVAPLKDLESHRTDCLLVALKAERLTVLSEQEHQDRMDEYQYRKQREINQQF